MNKLLKMPRPSCLVISLTVLRHGRYWGLLKRAWSWCPYSSETRFLLFLTYHIRQQEGKILWGSLGSCTVSHLWLPLVCLFFILFHWDQQLLWPRTGARLSILCLYFDLTVKYDGFSCHQRCLVTMATGWLAPKVWECSVRLLLSCSCLLRGCWGVSEASFHVNNQLSGRHDDPSPLSYTVFLCPQASGCSHSWTLSSSASFLSMPRSRSRWCLVPQTWQTGSYRNWKMNPELSNGAVRNVMSKLGSSRKNQR